MNLTDLQSVTVKNMKMYLFFFFFDEHTHAHIHEHTHEHTNALLLGMGWRNLVVVSLLQVMKKAHMARQKLLRLGIFKEVEVLIDTSEGTAGPSPLPSSTFCFRRPSGLEFRSNSFQHVSNCEVLVFNLRHRWQYRWHNIYI